MLSALHAPATHAEVLLHEWEQRTGPAAAYFAARPALLGRLSGLCATFRPGAAGHITAEDIRAVLGSAAAFSIGSARAAGPGRAIRVAQTVLATAQATPHAQPIGPAQQALLSIISPRAHPLDMDELTTILETIQHPLGQDAELVFGHDETEDASVTELWVWLLVGYGFIAQ